MTDEMKEVSNDELKEVVLFKFTNQVASHDLDNVLAMFYHGVHQNQLGIMTAWNLALEKEELILVGVQLDENGKPDCYPLCRILSSEDARLYLAPDGKGGYYDLADSGEVEEAKENMKSYAEAVEPAVTPEAELSTP